MEYERKVFPAGLRVRVVVEGVLSAAWIEGQPVTLVGCPIVVIPPADIVSIDDAYGSAVASQ